MPTSSENSVSIGWLGPTCHLKIDLTWAQCMHRAAVLTQSTLSRHPWTHVHGTWHDSRHRRSAHPHKISCWSDDGKAPIRTDVPSENLQVTKTLNERMKLSWPPSDILTFSFVHSPLQISDISTADITQNVGQSGQLKYQVNCYTFIVILKSNLVEFHTMTGAVLII